MKKILLTVGVVAGLVLAGTAQGQTASTGTDGTSTTTDTTSTETTGSFEALSPGNKDIASALYDANLDTQLAIQQNSTDMTGLTQDDIAAMKADGMGWGQIFKQMQAEGYISADVKNLGQVVSGYKHQQHGVTTGTEIVITNGAGGQVAVGGSDSNTNKGRSMAGLNSGSGHGPGHNANGSKVKGSGLGLGHGGSITTGHGSSMAGVTTASGHGIGNGGGLGKTTGHGGKVK